MRRGAPISCGERHGVIMASCPGPLPGSLTAPSGLLTAPPLLTGATGGSAPERVGSRSYNASMTGSDGAVNGPAADGSGPADVSDLLNRGVESLALVLELISALKAKGILTEDEVDAMGKQANVLRSEILNGEIPS
jgi:hypothetical protein